MKGSCFEWENQRGVFNHRGEWKRKQFLTPWPLTLNFISMLNFLGFMPLGGFPKVPYFSESVVSLGVNCSLCHQPCTFYESYESVLVINSSIGGYKYGILWQREKSICMSTHWQSMSCVTLSNFYIFSNKLVNQSWSEQYQCICVTEWKCKNSLV